MIGKNSIIPKIKICGLTRKEDIMIVNECQPDYVGFVFWEKSRRYINREKAAELRGMLSGSIRAAGVFVNEDIKTVAELLSDGIIDIAQLHGDESEDYIIKLREMTGKEIIRAFRLEGHTRKSGSSDPGGSNGRITIHNSSDPGGSDGKIIIHNSTDPDGNDGKIRIHNIDDLNGSNGRVTIYNSVNPDGSNGETGRPGDDIYDRIEASPADHVLLDSGMGSGKAFDWECVRDVKRPYFLAGGLDPDNVSRAIEGLRPYAVDVSSGVETEGFKDPEKIRRFVEAVRG